MVTPGSGRRARGKVLRIRRGKPWLTYLPALFIAIVAEGYAVLSAELLSIRQTTPFIGSGTDTVSVIIAGVLMPLAFGYHAGGKAGSARRPGGARAVLMRNIAVSALILLPGQTHILLEIFFNLLSIVVSNRLAQAAIYAALFLVTPVYLLGQTIPLVSRYFAKRNMSEITGKILCFSTLGSFLGAVFSTLALMSTIGVHNTAVILFLILFGLTLLLGREPITGPSVMAGAAALAIVTLNSPELMRSRHIVSNNLYNTVAVMDWPGGARLEMLNGTYSSLYSESGAKFAYARYLDRHVLEPLREGEAAQGEPKRILIIGAGAFTLGLEDAKNEYDYIDLDGSLKEIAERYVLKQKLGPNKHFYPEEARAWLRKEAPLYDVIILDAYQGLLTFPEQLAAREFFQRVKARLKPGGVMAANFIVSPGFRSRFSRSLDATFRSVFPFVSRTLIERDDAPKGQGVGIWRDSEDYVVNAIYLYRQLTEAEERDASVYTDNLNTVYRERPSGME